MKENIVYTVFTISSSSSIVSVSCIIVVFFVPISNIVDRCYFGLTPVKKVVSIVSVVSNVNWYCNL